MGPYFAVGCWWLIGLTGIICDGRRFFDITIGDLILIVLFFAWLGPIAWLIYFAESKRIPIGTSYVVFKKRGT